MAESVHQVYEQIKLWQPQKTFIPAEGLVPKGDHLFPSFEKAYNLCKRLAGEAPPRKNGEHWFIHPINVANNLKKAGITDPIALAAGLLHDYVEDQVDFYQEKKGIELDAPGLKTLHGYQQECFQQLAADLGAVASPQNVNKIVTVVDALTRYKENYYLYSMAGIFEHPRKALKEIAIQVKLADRMHNIQSLSNFTNERRLYECFKNLFVLNNAKQFIFSNYGKKQFFARPAHPTVKLFSQCCKATYEAFLRLCLMQRRKGISEVCTFLQLAFKKYQFEVGGLWNITTFNYKEVHPLRLYHGIVRKYEARLHQEWNKVAAMKEAEFLYCERLFAEYHFTREQIQAIIDYKDAYALKEVVAELLYDEEYIISDFLTSELLEGRIKENKA